MNELLEEKELIKYQIREHYRECNLKPIYQILVEEALESDEWDFMTDYNGCTAVSELHYDYYVFDCFVHDFLWITGRGGKIADKIFYDLMIARGLGKYIAKKRYIGVRIAWNTVYRWKHKFNGNVRPHTYGMELYKDLKGLH